MPSDAERWDARYRGELGRSERAPDELFLRGLDRLGAGANRSALDVACGTGRHALALAARGWRVSAWDVSAVAIDIVRERAAALGHNIDASVVDLPRELPEAPPRFDLVVVVDYLDREMFARLGDLVVAGGHLLLATFTVDWPEQHPSRRFRLERGELGVAPAGFVAVEHEERDGRAGLLARRSP